MEQCLVIGSTWTKQLYILNNDNIITILLNGINKYQVPSIQNNGQFWPSWQWIVEFGT